MAKILKGFFSESEAIIFEATLFNFWPKGIDKRWFWLGFQALEKGGLTYYETDEEEGIVRERLTLLSMFYKEFCHVACFHACEYFTVMSKEEKENILKDLSENADDELEKVKNALIAYFGDVDILLNELWINCTEGSTNTIMRVAEIYDSYRAIPTRELINDQDMQNARDWLTLWNKDIKGFESFDLSGY